MLAEQLRFTKAALLLNVAQPALSHQIRQLEEELGTQLVERSNRRVRLTAAGDVFLAKSAQILEELNQAARETARVGQGEAETWPLSRKHGCGAAENRWSGKHY